MRSACYEFKIRFGDVLEALTCINIRMFIYIYMKYIHCIHTYIYIGIKISRENYLLLF